MVPATAMTIEWSGARRNEKEHADCSHSFVTILIGPLRLAPIPYYAGMKGHNILRMMLSFTVVRRVPRRSGPRPVGGCAG
jgi:hypothetical protein